MSAGPVLTADDALAASVLALFSRGYDTVEIARLLRISEGRAYALLIRRRG